MAKLVFFAVVALALFVLSTAEGDNTLQQQCQRQLQQSSLDACRQVVDHQLAIQLPFYPRSLLLQSEWRTGVRVRCCQQLKDVSHECRATAIRHIVRRYEQQAMAPLTEGSYYPGEHEEKQGGSYYPSETYPQQEQGSEEQEEGWYHPSQEQGLYHPSQTYSPQHQEKWSYRPSQTFPQGQEQGGYRPSQEPGSYHPSQTYSPQHQEKGSYCPSQTFPQGQEQGWYRPSQEQGSYHPSQAYSLQHQEKGSYRPSQTFPQEKEQGWYRPSQEQGSYHPSQTYRPQHQEKGSYRPSQTFPQQQQHEGGFCGQSTVGQQQGRHESFGSPHQRIFLHHGQQPAAQHELSEITQQEEGQGQFFGRQSHQTGFGGSSSPHHFHTEKQVARLRQLRVVATARQVAAQLPAMCWLEGRSFSGENSCN